MILVGWEIGLGDGDESRYTSAKRYPGGAEMMFCYSVQASELAFVGRARCMSLEGVSSRQRKLAEELGTGNWNLGRDTEGLF